jgi:hypothetical protein
VPDKEDEICCGQGRTDDPIYLAIPKKLVVKLPAGCRQTAKQPPEVASRRWILVFSVLIDLLNY